MTDTSTHFEDGCHVVYNLNSLYHAFLAAKKDSDWKPQVQKYEMNFLPQIVKSKAIRLLSLSADILLSH